MTHWVARVGIARQSSCLASVCNWSWISSGLNGTIHPLHFKTLVMDIEIDSCVTFLDLNDCIILHANSKKNCYI